LKTAEVRADANTPDEKKNGTLMLIDVVTASRVSLVHNRPRLVSSTGCDSTPKERSASAEEGADGFDRRFRNQLPPGGKSGRSAMPGVPACVMAGLKKSGYGAGKWGIYFLAFFGSGRNGFRLSTIFSNAAARREVAALRSRPARCAMGDRLSRSA
jgi:hypothetical protein